MDRHKEIISDYSCQVYRGPGGGGEELRLGKGVSEPRLEANEESRGGQQAFRATATAVVTGKSQQLAGGALEFATSLPAPHPPLPPAHQISQAPAN